MEIKSLYRLALSLAVAASVGGCASAQTAETGPNLALVHIGAEASFVDLASVKTTGEVHGFRALVVSRTGQPQVGGWRQMSIDCGQNEFRTLAVHQVDEAGGIGPEELLSGQVFPVLGATPESAMASAICDKTPVPVRALNIVDATKIGRARLSQPK